MTSERRIDSGVPIRAATVRFPTVAPDRWAGIVETLGGLGFNAIDVPLVWREHERDDGSFDFTSGTRSLEAMLAAIHAAGLKAVVRLGPIATDDALGLCIPERVLRDRSCQARTRRQNPVFVPDPPRAVPLPSTSSRAFRAEVAAWISAASEALVAAEGTHGPAVRIILGDGPQATLRDDPFEMDHHPDARGDSEPVDPPHDGPQQAGLDEVRRETERTAEWREWLVDRAVNSGLDRARITVAIAGSARISPAAHRLAERYPLALPSPPPVSGSVVIWRQIRHALALCGSRGAHFDLWSGGPLYYPPMRGSHTLAAARVAIAAGARDFTVRMGCTGDRWMGAVLSESGELRPHAARWRELLNWAAKLPTGEEICADLVESPAFVEAARAATCVHPLPLGLLALLGLTPGQIATRDAPFEGGTLGEHEAMILSSERALFNAGVPARRIPSAAGSRLVQGRDEASESFAARARTVLEQVVPHIEPPGAALVRAVRSGGLVHLVVLSQSAVPASVTLRGAASWRSSGQPVSDNLELLPGEALVFESSQAIIDVAREVAERAAANKAKATAKPKRATPKEHSIAASKQPAGKRKGKSP